VQVPALPAMLNARVVNAGGFHFLLTGKIAIYRVFTRKYAIQKVR
jgi:hypothetical protein